VTPTKRIGSWFNDHTLVTCLIVIAAITIPGYFSLAGTAAELERVTTDQQDLITCLAEWADDTSERTAELNDLSRDSDESLGRLLEARNRNEPGDTQFIDYVAASTRYAEAVEAGEPDPPTLRCDEAVP
jgi:Tfp pilus assembly protein PilO